MKKTPNEIKVLIVDDEEALRKAIAFDFKRKGFQVFEAESGNKAIAMLDAQPIDIVISDVRMPDGDGISLLHNIKDKHASIPIVLFITGYADLTTEDAYDYGVDAILSKPFERKVLMQTIMDKLTAREELWSRPPASPPESSIENSVEAGKLSLGRGGFFLALQDPLPSDNSNVSFQIKNGPADKWTGQGIVRWVRREEKGDLSSGCGIEISYLDPQTLVEIVEQMDKQHPRAFIPKGKSK